MRRREVPPPPVYSAAEIKAIRSAIGFSQSEFADALNVNLYTVQGWEQGKRVPDGGNLRLLQIAQTTPEIIRSLALIE